jgi:hypothetical protein
MRRILSATLLATALWTGAAAADTPKATIDPKSPESAVLIPVQLLRGNDFKGFFDAMPAEDQAKAKAEWAAGQAKKGEDAKGIAEANEFLAKLLAPDATTKLMAEAEPKLKEMNPQELSQGLQMVGMIMAMSQMQQPKDGKKPDPAAQAVMAALSGILNDASQWVLTAGIEDPAKCKKAIERLVAGAKGLNVKDVKELQALPLDQFLARLSPLVKELKAAAAVYDVQLDAFLDSVKAKAGAAKDGKTPLDVSFTAFGKSYSLPVQVVQKDGHWVLSPDATNPLKSLMPQAPGMGPGGPEGMAMPLPTDGAEQQPAQEPKKKAEPAKAR